LSLRTDHLLAGNGSLSVEAGATSQVVAQRSVPCDNHSEMKPITHSGKQPKLRGLKSEQVVAFIPESGSQFPGIRKFRQPCAGYYSEPSLK
jgi:hypothetical protein